MPVSRSDVYDKAHLARWPYIQSVNIPMIDAEVDLLIGNNVPQALEPWEVINSQGSGPYAIRTLLGWTISGHINSHPTENLEPHVSINRILLGSGPSLDQQLANHFNHDFPESNFDDKPEKSMEDKQFIDIMDRTVKWKDGHYELALPFRDPEFNMPNNRQQAVERMISLKRKLQKNKKFFEDYKGFIDSIITEGYAQMVPEHMLQQSDGKIWYILHHGIYHPKKPEKIRVVFDCSARFRGTSLNDQLLQGPDLTNTLLEVMLRFRQEPVALIGDIESMFYQVHVQPSDYDVLRFLWWPNGNMNDEMVEYQMTVHIFGAVSSPSCSNFALKQTAKDNKDNFSPEITSTIENNFYVDDCLKSVATEEQAVKLVQDLSGGFHLTKWVSTSRTVLESIPESERGKEVKDLDLDQDVLPIERALGMRWCVESDRFMFRIEVQDRPATRRGILSIVSSVYDPLGFVAPYVLPAKRLLQELCKLKYSWDDVIPDKYLKQWLKWLRELPKIEEFVVDRCVKPTNWEVIVSTQIHHFADASESGYGTVSYLRQVNDKGQINCTFLFGKSQVAPLKQITIPRLELSAATLAVRMDRLLLRELEIPVEKSCFWTDSMSVLRYIQNKTTRFQTFVANRLAVIHDGTDPSQWHHVSSESNPADYTSRGMSVESLLKCSTWISGPSFLWKSPKYWTASDSRVSDIPPDDPEIKRKACVNTLSVNESTDTVNRLINYFSEWYNLKKAVAWI